jgi:hypothetical protein
MNDRSDQYWKTPDIYLAAFLYARGAVVVGMEMVDGKPIYSFLDSTDRRTWHTDYHTGTPTIDVRLYVYALRDLLQRSRKSLR